MEAKYTCHPWVRERRDRVTFALQATAGIEPQGKGKQLIAAGQMADRLGFDAFYLGDHPAWAPECWAHLAAVAVTTKRVWLGPMVAAAPYRTPLMTARLASDVDHLSDGRVVLGLGIGWNAADYGLGANEFDRMGLSYPSVANRQEALEEAITVIRGLWRGEPFSFAGKHYRTSEAQVDSPVQQPAPPLVIAGAGDHTLLQAARLADATNFGPGPAGRVDTPDDALRRLDILRRHCERVDRPFADILRGLFLHWLVLAPDQASLAKKVDRYFPNGLDPFWGRNLIAHTPVDAVAYFQGFVDVGIQTFVAQILDPDDEETAHLLITEVAPFVQPASSAG